MSGFPNNLLDLAKPLPGWTILHEENLVLPCLTHDFTDGHSHGGTIEQLGQRVKDYLDS